MSERNMTLDFTFENEDGEEIAYEFPAKFEVCGRCSGKGKHVNPSIDGDGITASEWAEWDEEEKDNYMSGAYDVTCDCCCGKRVVLVHDVEAIESAIESGDQEMKEAWEAYHDYEQSMAEMRAIERAERRFGA